MKILLVEDDKRLVSAISQILENEGYDVESVNDGKTALSAALSGSYDVIIMDLMLPGMDGLSVTKRLREAGNDTRIIIVSARGEIGDRIDGLNTGADDYLPKPFSPKELVARIHALTRRQTSYGLNGKAQFGDLEFDALSGTLSTESDSVSLTGKELEIVSLFFSNPESIYSKEKIIEEVWNGDPTIDDNNVEAYISFLRKKLAFLSSSVKIKTLRKVGYKLEA